MMAFPNRSSTPLRIALGGLKLGALPVELMPTPMQDAPGQNTLLEDPPTLAQDPLLHILDERADVWEEKFSFLKIPSRVEKPWILHGRISKTFLLFNIPP